MVDSPANTDNVAAGAGSAPSMVTSGALASVSVSEWEPGRQRAALAHQYFEGTPIQLVNVSTEARQ